MDIENLRPKNIKDLRVAARKQFGFYDKLCITTERVKVFSELFLSKKPKFLRNTNKVRFEEMESYRSMSC